MISLIVLVFSKTADWRRASVKCFNATSDFGHGEAAIDVWSFQKETTHRDGCPYPGDLWSQSTAKIS